MTETPNTPTPPATPTDPATGNTPAASTSTFVVPPAPSPWETAFPDMTPQQVREQVDAGRSHETRATEHLARAEAAEKQAMRLRVAVDKTIPADLVDLLTGDTPEEVGAIADRLKAHLAAPAAGATPETPGRPTGDIAQGPRSGTGAPALNDDDNLLKDVKGALGIR